MVRTVFAVVEKDDTGRVFRVPIGPRASEQWHTLRSNDASKDMHAALSGIVPQALTDASRPPRNVHTSAGLQFLRHIFSEFFLPAGYPASVSPDYLEYQIYNALQAFCSSLSGLLASRGALEGVGVGNASVSATQALILTVLKDVFSRFTTILGAYYFGSSLYPETKTFRYLADVFNDVSIVLDTVVPFIGSIDLSRYGTLLPSGAVLQTIALCLSGGLRSLCTLVGGGSKAALTNHFATPSIGKGDVGEVNAKDASRETIIGLSGMLLGTLLIPYINTRLLTYTVLSILVGTHLLLNYLAVRSVALRTLNRQRACILWTRFKTRSGTLNANMLKPSSVASEESLFIAPSCLRDASTRRNIGRCILGTSFRRITSHCTAEHIASALSVFEDERYVLFITGGNVGRDLRSVATSVCFKDGYRSFDQLQAWIQAIEVSRRLCNLGGSVVTDLEDVLRSTLLATREVLPGFVQSLIEAGWETRDDSMLFGSPAHVILGTERGQEGGYGDNEDRKQR